MQILTPKPEIAAPFTSPPYRLRTARRRPRGRRPRRRPRLAGGLRFLTHAMPCHAMPCHAMPSNHIMPHYLAWFHNISHNLHRLSLCLFVDSFQAGSGQTGSSQKCNYFSESIVMANKMYVVSGTSITSVWYVWHTYTVFVAACTHLTTPGNMYGTCGTLINNNLS